MSPPRGLLSSFVSCATKELGNKGWLQEGASLSDNSSPIVRYENCEFSQVDRFSIHDDVDFLRLQILE